MIGELESDLELVGRIAGGDRDAFAELYQRYFDGIYDLALRTIRNADLAADVAQQTFVRAWEHLRKGTRPENPKAWLYTIARNGAIDELRRGKRTTPDDSGGEGPSVIENQLDPSRFANPEDVVRDNELVGLVREAAAALNPREYSLLDLHLRKELSADELAVTLGLRRDNVYMMLSRLRDSLEEAVVCLLLMRRGRRDCPELDALLATRRAELTRDTRKAIRKHLDACAICQEQRKRFASPAEIFAGIAVVPVAVEVKGAIWREIAARIDAFEGAGLAGGSAGAGAGRWPRPSRTQLRAGILGLGAGLVLLAIAVLRPVLWMVSTSESLEAPVPAGVQQSGAVVPTGSPTRPAALLTATQVPVAVNLVDPDPEDPDGEQPNGGVPATSIPPAAGGTARPTSPVAPTATSPPATPVPGLAAPDAEPAASATATSAPTRPAPTASPAPAGGSDPTPTSAPAPPTVVATVEELTVAPIVVESTPTRSAVTPAAPAAATPTTAPTSAPQPATATAVPTAASTRTATPTPCPPLANPGLAATANPATNDVTLTWRSTGGCAPFSGSIQARYQQERGAYATHPVARASGTLTDRPPIRCEGTFTVVYALSLQDGAGASVSDTATATVRWIC